MMLVFAAPIIAAEEEKDGKADSPSIPNDKTVSMRIDDKPDPLGAAKTSIGFRLNKDDIVKAKLFNIRGQTVGIMTDTLLNEGGHRIEIDAWDLSWGVYWCIISTPDTSISTKILLLN